MKNKEMFRQVCRSLSNVVQLFETHCDVVFFALSFELSTLSFSGLSGLGC